MDILEELISKLRQSCEELVDPRQASPNLKYSIEDVGLSAFSIFFTQSPSFLAYQRQLERSYGTSNAQNLFGIKKIPTDNQIRKLLDETSADHFFPMFRHGFETFLQQPEFKSFQVLGGKILIPLDATQTHSSHNISCPNCTIKRFEKKQKKKAGTDCGEIIEHYSHSFVGASLCAPGVNMILPLEPEFIVPQDGHEKQDCEREAGKRWLSKYGSYYAHHQAVILGDDLYCCQSICEKVKSLNLSFIFSCKPDSHKTLYDFIDKAEMETIIVKGPRCQQTYLRFINDVPLNGNKETISVNWIEIKEVDKSGKTTYYNAFATDLTLHHLNAFEVAQAGRSRWKTENECFNTLKTKGYNLEHNYGHGNKNLANILTTLNILAFAFHFLADFMNQKYKKINELIKNRKEFFEEIRTLTKYMLFHSWDHLFNTMLESFLPRGPTLSKQI